MAPLLPPGTLLLTDRHWKDLRPYKKGRRNIFAIRYEGGCRVKYVEQKERRLILRPHNPEAQTEIIELGEDESPAEYIIGRVAWYAVDLG